MKYVNANSILPAVLVDQLQNYVQGGYIYIPAKQDRRKGWGESSGYREELARRNALIIEAYHGGESMASIADRHCLSIYAVRKIIYRS